MNKDTRTWIIGILSVLFSFAILLWALNDFDNEKYLVSIIRVICAIYFSWKGIDKIRKTID